jgi:hypothetical protein
MSKSLRKSDGTFAPGWRGGGRPPGARNRLTEVALRMLGEHFSEFGKEAIDRVYREKPAVYLQCVCSLLPRQVSIEKLSPFADLSDQELDLLQEFLASSRARDVSEINDQADKLENK